jgi:hypothetical protein
MTTIDCYLVITKKRGKEPRAVRVTQGRPALAHDEALIRLALDVPSDIFDAPLITVPVERRKVAVAVEVDEV